MRKIALALSALLVCCLFLSFNSPSEMNYEGLVTENVTSEYLFTTDNEILKTRLYDALPNVFDKVERVDAHWGKEMEYYFTVYGIKDGKAMVDIMLVSEKMACNQIFPSLAELGIKDGEAYINCYWKKIDIGLFTIKVCSVDGDGAKCGVSPSGGLCVRVKDIDPEPIEP